MVDWDRLVFQDGYCVGELGWIEMGVYLGGHYRCVSEDVLYYVEVNSSINHAGCACVAQSVDDELLIAGESHLLPDRAPCCLGLMVLDSKGLHRIIFPPSLQHSPYPVCHRYAPWPISLVDPDRYQVTCEIDILISHVQGFG